MVHMTSLLLMGLVYEFCRLIVLVGEEWREVYAGVNGIARLIRTISSLCNVIRGGIGIRWVGISDNAVFEL